MIRVLYSIDHIFIKMYYFISCFNKMIVSSIIESYRAHTVTMFSKKKKKPLISPPSNFEHRVHTGFDRRENKYVGLPLQWASLVGNNQVKPC